MKLSSLSFVAQLLVSAALCSGITAIGLLLSFGKTDVSLFWSPAAFSILFLYSAGTRFLPAVFFSVAIVYGVSTESLPHAVIYGIGSSIEALIGSALLKRTGFQPAILSRYDILKLIVLCGGFSTFVNAHFIAASMSLLYPESVKQFIPTVLLYWTSNLSGFVVFAPLLSMALHRDWQGVGMKKGVEFAGVMIVVYGLLHPFFQEWLFQNEGNQASLLIFLSLAVMASIRYGMIGSSTVSLIYLWHSLTISMGGAIGQLVSVHPAEGEMTFIIPFIVYSVISVMIGVITEEHEQAEHVNNKNNERYALIAEQTGQLTYDYDVETGRIVWNGAITPMTQYTPEEFSSVDIHQWAKQIHPDDRERAERLLEESMRIKSNYHVEYRFQRKDGSFIDIVDQGVFLYRHESDTLAYRMLGTMANVTAMKDTIHKLKQSEDRYKLFSMLTSDYIYSSTIIDGGYFTDWVSESFRRITGYTLDDINQKGMWDRIIHPDDRDAVNRALADVLKGEPKVVEYRLTIANGTQRWLRDYVKPIIDEKTRKVSKMMGGVQDITERKVAEERFRVLIERSADGIILMDKRGIIEFVSPSASEIIGYAPEELLNKSVFEILHPAYAKKYAFKFGRLVREFDRSEYLLGLFKHKNGRWVHIEGMVTNLFNNPSVNAFVANFRNVTDRINADEQLRQSLHEKEILLKEVHHRVKNNMQVISSLLNLQSAVSRNSSTLALLRESQNRVKSMALVHEILYQSQDLSSVNFLVYARQLIVSLQKSFGAKSGHIAITVKIANIRLSITDAIPCGLIINELISNAVKYAFPNKRKGEISVEMKKTNTRVTLIVNDNGIGLPKRLPASTSLGLKLVQALVDQLHGTINFQAKRGTRITIQFPSYNVTAA